MNILIWGTGNYCKYKLSGMCINDIVAFIDREPGVFMGKRVIIPSQIDEYDYNQIVVLSAAYLDIIPELIEMNVDYKKIIPGICINPLRMDEVGLVSNNTEINVLPNGTLEFVYGVTRIIIQKKEDWSVAKNTVLDIGNVGRLSDLSVKPVAKDYGFGRGGSICRYYIHQYLKMHQHDIRGNILEIGDRSYTEQFMGKNDKSYVLHFGDDFEVTEYDFVGDLRTGKGIKRNFYDCIILTQVINFVSDLSELPQILVDCLAPGGVILITANGITNGFKIDRELYGHYWNFTDQGIRQLFDMKNVECETTYFGNFKVACFFLAGMSTMDLKQQELDYVDEDYQVLVCAKIRKNDD